MGINNIERTMKGKFAWGFAALTILVSILALSGCSQSGSEQPQSTNVGSAPTATVESQEDEPSFNYDVAIEPTELVNNDVAKIVANSISIENNQLNVDMSVTNNSKHKFKCYGGSLGFSGNFINNYMVETGWFSTELAPGKSENVIAKYDLDYAEMYGIGEIDEVGIGVEITQNKPYKTLLKDIYTLKTNLYNDSIQYTNTYNSMLPKIAEEMGGEIISASDTQLFDKKDIVLTSPALLKNSSDDLSVMIDAINNNSKWIELSFSDLKINGESAVEYPFKAREIASGKRAVIDIDLSYYSSQIDQDISDPSSIKSISFKFEAEDSKGNTILSKTSLEIKF